MVSVIVPVYNVEPYLRECLDSIITQSYTDLQIIIIDDGSTDGSGAICDAYATKDTRVQVVHQENRGLSAARNLGIELATGEYLCFVDSDDYLLPDCIGMLLRLCLDYNADMSSCAHILLSNENDLPSRDNHPSPGESELFVGAQKMESYIKQRKLRATAWGKLYTAGLFREIRYPEGRIYEDSTIFHRIVHAAKRIVCTPRFGYVYRKRPHSITTKPFSMQSFDHLTSCLERVSFIRENYPALLPYTLIQLVTTCHILIRKIAESPLKFPDAERKLQALCRKNLLTYLIHGPSFKSRILVLLICINTKLAKTTSRIYSQISKKDIE